MLLEHSANITQVEKLPSLCINSGPSRGEVLLLSAGSSCPADFHFNILSAHRRTFFSPFRKGTFACYCWYHAVAAPRTTQAN